MTTVAELNKKANDLQAELQAIENAKETAKQQEYDEKVSLISIYQNEANGYRNQALKAESDDEKQKLYRFADQADNLAIELKKELGLYTPDDEQQAEEIQQTAKFKTLRSINSLLIKSAISLVSFFVADYTAGQMEAGFFTYALKSVAQVLYFVASGFGGCWLACVLLYSFISDYAVSDLADDFQSLNPTVRVCVLTALIACVLLFLSSITPHAN